MKVQAAVMNRSHRNAKPVSCLTTDVLAGIETGMKGRACPDLFAFQGFAIDVPRHATARNIISLDQRAARMRIQERMPLWNEVRSYFSFGE